MKRAAYLLLAGGVLVSSGSARAQDVRVSWSAPRAFVGEQVRLEVEIVHPISREPRWKAPVFEGFLAERLPTEGGPMRHDARDEPVRTTRFQRALFPARAGQLEIPASTILLLDRSGGETERAVPATRIRVEPLPDAERPSSFDGLTVGQVTMRIAPTEGRLALGESLRFRVDVFGTAHMGEIRGFDLEALLGADAEVFDDPADTRRTVRNGRLITRKSFGFALVPSRPGPLAVPALEVAHFDPGSDRYRVARTPPILIQVEPAPRDPQPVRSDVSDVEPGTGSLPAEVRVALWLLAAGAVLAGLALALRTRRGELAGNARRDRALSSEGGSSPTGANGPSVGRVRHDAALEPGAIRERLDELARCAGGPEGIAELRACLRAVLRVRHGSHCDALTPAELETRTGDREAAGLMRQLDRARFASRPLESVECVALIDAVRRYAQDVTENRSSPGGP